MTTPQPDSGISELHARSVMLTLRMLEETLFQVEEYLARDKEGVFVVTRTEVSPLARIQLRTLIAEARGELAAIATAFQLPHHERDGRQVLLAQLTQAWAILEDTRPEKLNGYGPVSPQETKLLDPPVVRLISLIEAMRVALQR